MQSGVTSIKPMIVDASHLGYASIASVSAAHRIPARTSG
jgi:hypothetical protein